MTNNNPDLSERIRIGDRVTISPRGKRGTWTAEFNHNGKHCHRSLKTANVKIARQRAIALEAELASGNYAAPVRPISVADAMKEFMDNRESEGRSRKTLVKYQSELDLFQEFLTQQDAHTLTQITPSLFDQYRVHRSKGHAEKTVYVCVLILKTFVRWCVDREMLDRNPLRSCKMIEPYVPPKRVPNTKQVQDILAATTGRRQVHFAMLTYTGLRAGELQMLRPQDVDLEHGWIHVRAHDGWVPKTRQARKIPIHPKLLTHLAAMPKNPRPFFFVADASAKYPAGGHHIDIRTLNEQFQHIAKALGMPVGRKHEGFVIHSLRHYFETTAVDSGVPQFVVDAWMGHAGAAVMGKVYYGLDDEKSKAFMKQVKF